MRSTTGPSTLAACVLFLTGCVCDCDVERIVATRAGPSATSCGLVALDEDVAPTIDCLALAIAEGRAAYGGWQRRGRDTEVWTYLAGHGDSYALFGYDGGLSGQCATLVETPCDELPMRFTGPEGREVLSCPSSDTLPICDR
jgi:hypothetical protein